MTSCERTFVSRLLSKRIKFLATQPPCLPGAFELVVSGFSHPRLPLTSLILSPGGSHSVTIVRCLWLRTADANSWAMDVLVCVEVSTSNGRYMSRQLSCSLYQNDWQEGMMWHTHLKERIQSNLSIVPNV